MEVFLSDENDYGMGSGNLHLFYLIHFVDTFLRLVLAYWKGGNSQGPSQTQNTIFGSQAQSQPNGAILDSQDDFATQPRSRADDDFESQPVPRQSRQPPSRGGSAAPKRAATRSKPPAKPASALFLDSDDDIQMVEEGDQEERAQDDVEPNGSSTLRSTAQRDPSPKRPTRSSKPKAKVAKPVIIDDDSDDGIVFKGFKGRKGRQ